MWHGIELNLLQQQRKEQPKNLNIQIGFLMWLWFNISNWVQQTILCVIQ